MQEKFLFEYAVIRVMPRVEREEFLNVGIILFCAKQKFLKSIFYLNESRICAFSPETDIPELKENLDAFQRISEGIENSGPIGQYDMASRFRWLTATRSTVVQCSKVHPGFCTDAEETLQKLHQQLVL
ncbi:DUF3037 domain-containing protein [Pedobacter punctiformis]|uniref:DUF3037 domain-containing protein n=1 Tax=Pedobacter punctiformis TaxID=3004097 RepID=A0ABT4L7L1_9SPHI|nr:DUF3037 domain-containing protein [Pedobacter sp. HCMS5-2]MCZ4243916.1 DUF3037 domain-containing protein [Pedobacter sp. HCMS5-2]